MIIAELTKFFLRFPLIFFPTDNFSRNCGCFRDISPLQPWFLPVLRRFPVHFTSAAVVSPGFAAISGTFSLPGSICSTKNTVNREKIKPRCNILPEKMLFNKKIPHTMKKKILPIIVSIFWIAFFSYLTYIKLYAVVILSLILLTMTMAMSVSNEAEN